MGHSTTRLAARDALYVYTDEASHGDTPNIMTDFYVFDTRRGIEVVDTHAAAVAWILERIHRTPTLCRRLRRVPGDLDYPYWIETEVDPGRHIQFRRIGATSRDDLHRLFASIAERPLDLDRPLWEMHVLTDIRGVGDLPDRATVVALRAHHSVTDGLGLVQIARALFDDPDAAPSAGGPPTRVGIAGSVVKLPGRFVRLARTAAGSAQARRSLDALVREGTITMPETCRPRTRFNVEAYGRRQFGRVRLDLAEVRAIARVTGTTVNHVVLAIVSAAVNAFLTERGEEPTVSLAAQVPVSISGRADVVAENRTAENKTTVSFVDLHTDEDDPLVRLHLIRASAELEKDRIQRPESIALDALLLDTCPAFVLRNVIRREFRAGVEAYGGGTVPSQTILSNCARGPAGGLRFGGSPAVDGFSAPVLNRTSGLLHMTTSLGDVLNVAFSSKETAMPDPAEYERQLSSAFEELRGAVVAVRAVEDEAAPSTV